MIFNIASLNVNGLRTMDKAVPKRRKLFTWFKQLKLDAILLQETHSDSGLERIIKSEWGGQAYFSHGDNRSRGVAILFNPDFDGKVNEVKTCSEGRYVVLSMELNHTNVVLANVYGPNWDRPDSFSQFFHDCEEIDSDFLIIGGDWNFVFNIKMDRISASRRASNNDRCRDRVQTFMGHRGLVDIWRLNNLERREFTFIRNNPKSKSRIDFFLISDAFLSQLSRPKTTIEDGYLADHKMVTLKVQVGKPKFGKPPWKHNDSRLIDPEYVSYVKKSIKNAMEMNATPDVSKHILFQTVLCVVRGDIIKYASEEKRKLTEELEAIETKINEATAENSIIEGEYLIELKKKRDEIIKTRTERNMFRCRANWRQNAERGTKYFHSLVKEKRGSNTYAALNLENTEPGMMSDDINKMLAEAVAHFEKRYGWAQTQDDFDRDNFFANISQLSNEEMRKCETELSETELRASLYSMENGSSPGPDGFTAAFYKVFWDELKELISQLVGEMLENNMMPEQIKCSITTLIPKKGKDKQWVKNLRPISLLNVIYKIITKALAIRLSNVIQPLINEDQTGFLKGRFIGENVRMIIDILNETKEHNIPGLLLFCDIQQAYDTVSWKYLKIVLERFGFGPNFLRWVSMMYDHRSEQPATARIVMNGHLSRPYLIQRGLRQGCPLSCLLFPVMHRAPGTNDTRGCESKRNTV